MKTVILHGALGKVFGREFVLDIKTPAEAIRALGAMKKGFVDYILKKGKEGVTYNLRTKKNTIATEGELNCRFSGDVLEIRLIVMGSKRDGILQTIVGVALIAVSYFFPVLAPYTLAPGIALTAGGIIQMFSNPKGGDTEQKRSYLFSGPASTQVQGGPVPVGYGRLIVGPQLINAGITTDAEPLDADYIDYIGDGYTDMDYYYIGRVRSDPNGTEGGS